MSSDTLNRAVRANLIEHTMVGVCNTVARIFSARSGVCGRNVMVLPVSNPDALEAALRDRAAQSPETAEMYSLPIVGVSIQDVGEISDGGGLNRTAMQRVGAPLGVEDHGQFFVVMRGTPVAVTFQITFLTDDMRTLLRMVDAWMSYSQWKFQLRLKETQKSIGVTLNRDQQLAIPPRAPGAGGSDQFRLVTNLTAKTYSGSLWKIPAIAKTIISTVVGGKNFETALEEGGIEIVDVIDREAATNIGVPTVEGNTEVGVFFTEDGAT